MNLSTDITFTSSSVNNFPVDFAGSISATPEIEEVEKSVNDILNRAKSSPLHNRELCINQIRTLANNILNEFASLQKSGVSPEELKRQSLIALNALNTTFEQFSNNNQTYEQRKESLKVEFDQMHKKIDNAGRNLTFKTFEAPKLKSRKGSTLPLTKPKEEKSISQSIESAFTDAMSPKFGMASEATPLFGNKGDLEQSMMWVNGAAIIPRKIEEVVEMGLTKFCRQSETTQEACRMTGAAIEEFTKSIGLDKLSETIHHTTEIASKSLQDQMNIPKEETEYAIHSMEIVGESLVGDGLGKFIESSVHFASKAKSLAKSSSRQHYITPEGRIDYSSSYFESNKKFMSPPKEFSGKLPNDLELVQFVGPKGTYRHWARPEDINKIKWEKQLLDHLGILQTKFGDRITVNKARIPAGTDVTYLYGASSPMKNIFKLEFRSGGGFQMIFKDFNPEWIVASRPLPFDPHHSVIVEIGEKIAEKIPELTLTTGKNLPEVAGVTLVPQVLKDKEENH